MIKKFSLSANKDRFISFIKEKNSGTFKYEIAAKFKIMRFAIDFLIYKMSTKTKLEKCTIHLIFL